MWDDRVRVDATIAEKRKRFKAYNVMRAQSNLPEVEAATLAFQNWVLRVLNSTRGKNMNPGIFPQNLRANNANRMEKI